MKKTINYQLQAIKLNKGMSYKTTDKLKFGSTVYIEGILWRISGINE